MGVRNAKWFQHTAARRRLAAVGIGGTAGILFQHTAARRRLCRCRVFAFTPISFQHTAARRRLYFFFGIANNQQEEQVSTHSRPKAAGNGRPACRIDALVSTHSRPKAAVRYLVKIRVSKQFQHTAARRRLAATLQYLRQIKSVSTHSRPKAAALNT